MTAPDAPITTDLRCSKCGYNLRTLPRRGRCPECGRSVAHTMLDTPSWLGDSAWQGRTMRGLMLVVVGVTLAALMLASLFAAVPVLVRSTSATTAWHALLWAWITLPAVVLAAGMCNAATLRPGMRWDETRRALVMVLWFTAGLRVVLWLGVGMFGISTEAVVGPMWLLAAARRLPDPGLLLGALLFIEALNWTFYLIYILRLNREARTSGARFAWLMLGLLLGLLLVCVVAVVAGSLLLGAPRVLVPTAGLLMIVLLLLLAPTLTLWGALRRAEREV